MDKLTEDQIAAPTPDQEVAAKLRAAFFEFNKGCSNTQIDNDPPESCPECADAFVEAVRRIAAGHQGGNGGAAHR